MKKKIFWIGVSIAFFITGIVYGAKYFNKADKNLAPFLVVSSFGGSYQDSMREAFFKPFEKATGVKIRETTYSGKYPELKNAIEKGHKLDVVDLESTSLFIGQKEGMLQPLDFSVINKEKFISEAVNTFGVASIFCSNIIAYNTEVFPEGTLHPTTWAEFWDLNKFPGKRGLHKYPFVTLEIALLADGVDPKNLYPLDVDRALKSLSKIKNNIVWWDNGSQPVDLLSNREVVASSAWNGRIWVANNMEKKPLAVEWNQGLLDVEYWAVPKNSVNKNLAMRFIEFVTGVEQQAAFTRYISYGPTNKQAIKLVDSTAAADLSSEPSNKQKQIMLNSQWWAENSNMVFEKWNAWLKE